MKKLIGNRAFYGMVLRISIPIMIQMGITNFVGLLDNIMVGQIGTEEMSGVAIVNQLIFVFNICVFGGVSGAGIFGAQFYGKGDHEGVKSVLRFKLLICSLIGIVATVLLGVCSTTLISLFLNEGSESGDLLLTLQYAKDYLFIMLWGLLPFAIKECYASTLKETEQTIVPMKASVAAFVCNLCFNYVLIFGKMGFPQLGVEGAAIATVVSRWLEVLIVIIWTHRNRKEYTDKLLTKFYIPSALCKQIIIKGTPLLLNETLWSAGMATMNQCFSLRGLSVVAAININSTITNMFSVVYLALGGSIAIVVGKILGAGKMDEAKDTAIKMIVFSTASCLLMSGIMAAGSQMFVNIYNTTNEVRELAKSIIYISALMMPLAAFNHSCYFTLRSGGKTIITFLFDSAFVWVISIPAAFVLTHYTALTIVIIYLLCQSLELMKCILGYALVQKGIWIQNIIGHKSIENG